MQKFKVDGVHPDTGKPVSLVLEADTVEEAEDQARAARAILIESTTALTPPPAATAFRTGMAICATCGQTISRRARTCPRCGDPGRSGSQFTMVFWLTLDVLLSLLAISLLLTVVLGVIFMLFYALAGVTGHR